MKKWEAEKDYHGKKGENCKKKVCPQDKTGKKRTCPHNKEGEKVKKSCEHGQGEVTKQNFTF